MEQSNVIMCGNESNYVVELVIDLCAHTLKNICSVSEEHKLKGTTAVMWMIYYFVVSPTARPCPYSQATEPHHIHDQHNISQVRFSDAS